MHDIICPHCGASYIASDVSFDMSKEILPLLSGKGLDPDSIKELGFIFLVDEEMIHQGLPENSPALKCDQYEGNENWCHYTVSLKSIYNYIKERSASKDIDELARHVGNESYNFALEKDTSVISSLFQLYKRFFKKSETLPKENQKDENFRDAVSVLSFIFDKKNEDKSKTFNILIFASPDDNNRYQIPDHLIIWDGARKHYIRKCCPYCTLQLPLEYGHYKSYPVVLLGSHFSGKTSYLLSLLYTVLHMEPFALGNQGSLFVKTLNTDPDLEAFSKNIGNYMKGRAPNKTDFSNIPVLNLLVGKGKSRIIYEFIDWPGEMFIRDGFDTDINEFIESQRPVIMKSRHFFCFLEPSQIDNRIAETEERVVYDPIAINNQFTNHIFRSSKTHSIVFIMNKMDKIINDRNNADQVPEILKEVMKEYDDTKVYSGDWIEEGFNQIQKAAKEYLKINQPAYLRTFVDRDVPVYYLPVAPYGHSADSETDNPIHDAKLSGVPLLRIIRTDGII